jgi:putative colanic acid biosynthesis acetyltransferase WcaF
MLVDLEKYDNSWYRPGGVFKRLSWMIASALFFQHALAFGSRWKVVILRLFGASVGRGVVVKPRVNIKYPWFLVIGDNTWIGEGVWIDNIAQVQIGRNCCLSQGALLLTGNHNYRSEQFDLLLGPILLENGVWIGAKAIVCPNAYCKSHSVVLAGGVVSKQLESYSIYGGNPAVKIKERIFTWVPKPEHY